MTMSLDGSTARRLDGSTAPEAVPVEDVFSPEWAAATPGGAVSTRA
ncbi:hypothetical protein ABZ883_20870 [Streptomyces sp. NPDC046977]